MSDTRVRLVLQVPEDVRLALRLEAAELGKDMSEIVEGWIRKYCKDALARVRRRVQAEDKDGASSD